MTITPILITYAVSIALGATLLFGGQYLFTAQDESTRSWWGTPTLKNLFIIKQNLRVLVDYAEEQSDGENE